MLNRTTCSHWTSDPAPVQNAMSKYDGKADASRIWAAVRRLGRQATPASVDGVAAEILNRHYADISTDPQYTEPVLKQLTDATLRPPQCISEGEMFHMLDTLRPTSAGLDGLPAWYLKVSAPIFCNQLAYLFNLSLATTSVPRQWKEACKKPIQKYQRHNSRQISDPSR